MRTSHYYTPIIGVWKLEGDLVDDCTVKIQELKWNGKNLSFEKECTRS